MSFSDCYLLMLEKRFNLLVAELFQVKTDVNISEHKKLYLIILREIANGEIKSSHFTKNQALMALDFMEVFDCKKAIEDIDVKFKIGGILNDKEFNTSL